METGMITMMQIMIMINEEAGPFLSETHDLALHGDGVHVWVHFIEAAMTACFAWE